VIYIRTTPASEAVSRYASSEGLHTMFFAQNPEMTDPRELSVPDRVEILTMPADGRDFEAPAQMESRSVRVARATNEPLLSFEQGRLTGDRSVIQAFVSLSKSHELHEKALGRKLAYRSEDGKLSVQFDVPVMGTGASEGTLHYAESASAASLGDPDIAAHEQAHLVLEALRPFYSREHKLTTGALHEGVADSVAFVMALQDRDLREETVNCWLVGRSSSKASRLAEGHTAPYDQPLRDISELPQNPDLSSPHQLSRPFSHGFFKALRAVGEGRSKEALTEDVLLQTSQDFLTLLDLGMEFLPVSGQATVQHMLTAMLKVDRLVFQSRYQRALTENFQSVGLVPQSEQVVPSDIAVEMPEALTRNSYQNSFGMHFTHFHTPAGRGLMVATDEGNLIHLESPAKQNEKRTKG
jgi:hypothetical protein